MAFARILEHFRNSFAGWSVHHLISYVYGALETLFIKNKTVFKETSRFGRCPVDIGLILKVNHHFLSKQIQILVSNKSCLQR